MGEETAEVARRRDASVPRLFRGHPVERYVMVRVSAFPRDEERWDGTGGVCEVHGRTLSVSSLCPPPDPYGRTRGDRRTEGSMDDRTRARKWPERGTGKRRECAVVFWHSPVYPNGSYLPICYYYYLPTYLPSIGEQRSSTRRKMAIWSRRSGKIACRCSL